jgi:hypothetical protein
LEIRRGRRIQSRREKKVKGVGVVYKDSLIHYVSKQLTMMSVVVPFNIVLLVDHPSRKRMTASVISIHGKRKPLPSSSRIKMLLGAPFE